MALWNGSSLQVEPSVRLFLRLADAHGLDLAHGPPSAVIAAAFSLAVSQRETSLAPSTLKTYMLNCFRFATLFLEPPGARFDELVRRLITNRVQRWTGPTLDNRAVFTRSHVRAALAHPGDPAIRAALALMWDTLSRAGSLLTVPSPSGRLPMPASNLSVLDGPGDHCMVVLVTFEKTSKQWVKLRVSTDPASAYYNPAGVGSPRRLAELVAGRPSSALWRTRAGRSVTSSDVVRHLVAANASIARLRITPHSFRISAVSALVFGKLASLDHICRIGRWSSQSSLLTYIRSNEELKHLADLR